MKAMPYFLTNKSWYTETYDENGFVTYHLTNAAPKEAKDSFDEYYKPPKFYDEDGNEIDFSGRAFDL